MVLLHPDLGNYSLVKHPGFEIGQNELLDFKCPYCAKKLESDRHKNLARILIRDENGMEGEVHFSRISGQQCTYRIIGENMEIYGRDAADYYEFIVHTHF